MYQTIGVKEVKGVKDNSLSASLSGVFKARTYVFNSFNSINSFNFPLFPKFEFYFLKRCGRYCFRQRRHVSHS